MTQKLGQDFIAHLFFQTSGREGMTECVHVHIFQFQFPADGGQPSLHSPGIFIGIFLSGKYEILFIGLFFFLLLPK